MRRTSERVTVTPDQVNAFFFRAMMKGYASGHPAEQDFPLPGFQASTHKERDFELIDMWATRKGSNYSSGLTIIYWKRQVVWDMHYGGRYYPEAIDTLKTALKYNYERAIFEGGRGPKTLKVENLIYINRPVLNSFTLFEGVEEIRDGSTNRLLGYHKYSGQWYSLVS